MNAMKMKPIVLAGLYITTSSLVPVLASNNADKTNKKVQKPNVLFIFSDQHRADVMSGTNHPDVHTPNLDRLANQGVRFDRAYSNDAVSVPSRSSLFTGLYPRTLGILDNSHVKSTAITYCVSMQKMFQQNGYDTYAYGKRHLFDQVDEGWTEEFSDMSKESKSGYYTQWVEEAGYADQFGQDWAAEFGRYPKGNSLSHKKTPSSPMGTKTSSLPEGYTMEAFASKKTLAMLEKRKKNDKPFFCFTSFYHPHQPYTPLPKYLKRYDKTKWGKGTKFGDAIAMPATLREPAENLTPFMNNLRKNERGIWCLGKAAKDEQLYRDYIAAYYALVDEIDFWVGELINKLEETGLDENTLVIYSSDHGDFVGNHGMIEKAAAGHNIYEETIRVPLIFYWKGKLHIGANDELVQLIDIYPTLVDMLGLKTPKNMQFPLAGKSLKATLTKGEKLDRDYIITENWSQATVITKDKKLGMWLDANPRFTNRNWAKYGNMFFDRAADIHETNNVYPDVKDSKEVKKMEGYFNEFVEEISAIGKEEVMTVYAKRLNNKAKRRNNKKNKHKKNK